MQMTQQGQLSQEDRGRLFDAKSKAIEAEHAFQVLAVEMVGKSSFREVAKLLDMSTNTLQRWKRGVGK